MKYNKGDHIRIIKIMEANHAFVFNGTITYALDNTYDVATSLRTFNVKESDIVDETFPEEIYTIVYTWVHKILVFDSHNKLLILKKPLVKVTYFYADEVEKDFIENITRELGLDFRHAISLLVKLCLGMTKEEILNKLQIDKSFFVLPEKPKKELPYYSRYDYIIRVSSPKFQRFPDNKNAKTFDLVSVDVGLKPSLENKLSFCKEHKKEIILSGLHRINDSNRFKEYGVPVNILKLYNFTLMTDSYVRLSFELKRLKEEAE